MGERGDFRFPAASGKEHRAGGRVAVSVDDAHASLRAAGHLQIERLARGCAEELEVGHVAVEIGRRLGRQGLGTLTDAEELEASVRRRARAGSERYVIALRPQD